MMLPRGRAHRDFYLRTDRMQGGRVVSRSLWASSGGADQAMLENRLTVTLVVPLLNQAGRLPEIHAALDAVSRAADCRFQFLFVDDGSTDDTEQALARLHRGDSRVEYVVLMRTAGWEPALEAARDYATGDAIIVWDASLQHAPSAIAELIGTWHGGREETPQDVRPPAAAPRIRPVPNARLAPADLRLFSRNAFLRLGPPEVDQPDGDRGRPPDSTRFPRAVLWGSVRLGFLSALAGSMGVLLLSGRFLLGHPPASWTWVLACVLILGGLQLAATGRIARYVLDLVSRVNRGPRYVVRRAVVASPPDAGQPSN